STFSSHITNIIRIVAAADERSLVLLDELAAGTDPTEGAALARAILMELLDAGALVVATTHHGELKAFAHATPGVTNASVEFNLETLTPTYHLSIGLPGRSNALEIAGRLGMPRTIIDAARASIAPEQRQVEELLSDIHRERESAAGSRRAEESARREAEEIRLRLEEKLDAIDDERAKLLAAARDEVAHDVERARRLLAEAEKQIERNKLEAAAAKLREAHEHATRLAERAERPTPRRRPEPRAPRLPAGPPPTSIQEGDLVWLRGMDRFGEALSGPDAKGEVELRMGALHTRIKLSQVERVQRPAPSRATGAVTADLAPPPRDVGDEIDVRGQTIDEAVPNVEQYIDEAFRAGLGSARIIHGKGTGALRREVRGFLAKYPLVKSYEEAPREQGGEGVTIAHLAV
ncbi:MAG: endonuclease MutS2, partial [Dehalococcoidia bacterium]